MLAIPRHKNLWIGRSPTREGSVTPNCAPQGKSSSSSTNFERSIRKCHMRALSISPCELLCLTFLIAGSLQGQGVVLDGKLDDAFWRRCLAAKLVPGEEGVPAERGGEVRAAVAGRYLYVGAILPEQGGRVVARSV